MESVLWRSDPVIDTHNMEPLKKDYCSMLKHVCPFCGGNAKFSGFRLPPIKDTTGGAFLVCSRCHGKWCPSCRQPRHKAKECLMFKYGQLLTGIDMCSVEGSNKAMVAGQIGPKSPGDGIYTIEKYGYNAIKHDNFRTRMEMYGNYKDGLLCDIDEPRQMLKESRRPGDNVFTIEQNGYKSIKHDDFRSRMESYRNDKGGVFAIAEPKKTPQQSQGSEDEVFTIDQHRNRSMKHDDFRTRMEYYRDYKGGIAGPKQTPDEKTEIPEDGETIKQQIDVVQTLHQSRGSTVDANKDIENISSYYPIDQQINDFEESKETIQENTEQKGHEAVGEEPGDFMEENVANDTLQEDGGSEVVTPTERPKGNSTSTYPCPKCGVNGRCTGLYQSGFYFRCLTCKSQWCYFCRRPNHEGQKCGRARTLIEQNHRELRDTEGEIRTPLEETTSVVPQGDRRLDGQVSLTQGQGPSANSMGVHDHMGNTGSGTDSRTPILSLPDVCSNVCPHCGMNRYSIGSFIPSVLNDQSNAHYLCLACNGKWELTSQDRRNIMAQARNSLESQMQLLYLRELYRAPTKHFCPFCGMDGAGTGLFTPWDESWSSFFICLNCNWEWCPFCKKYNHDTLSCAAYRALCHGETNSAEIKRNSSPLIPTNLGQSEDTESRDSIINGQTDRSDSNSNVRESTRRMPVGQLLSMGECLTCLETTSVLKAKECDVALCTTCINTYMEGKIDEGATDIKCPGLQCGSFYHPDIIKTLIKPDKWKRFDYLRVRANMDPDRKACPLCDFILIVEDDVREYYKTFESIFVCPGCEKEWCFHCEVPWHENVTCGEYRTLVLTTGVDVWAAKAKQSGERNAQQCPKCKTWIEKTAGCNMMTCRECKTKFCYNCGVKTPHPNGSNCSQGPNPNVAPNPNARPNPNVAPAQANRIHPLVPTYRPRHATAYGARPPVHRDDDLCCCSIQ